MTTRAAAAPPGPEPTFADVVVTHLDHDGSGRATTGDGEAVRVPFALPGERVRVRIWRRAAGEAAAQADLVEVSSPAPERRAPACALFGVCAGCQLQHLRYDAQLAWKTAVVRGLMAPAGAAGVVAADVVAACVGSPRELGYRSKITPHHERLRPGTPLAIGFLKAGRRHEVVDVPCCPLATDGINAALPALRARATAAAALPKARRGVTFLLRESASGVTSDPDLRVTEHVGDLRLEFFAREFFQNNPFLLPRLVAYVVDAAAASGARRLVDTYSGSGLFALAAAARFELVAGVEVSPGAVAAARANAARNGRENVQFLAADAARIFAGLGSSGAEAAVIVDPPRKGCDEAFLAQLTAFGPARIVYVSCNPETLARDLGRLAASGYRAIAIQPFDMFPQTRHVECVAVVDRGVTR